MTKINCEYCGSGIESITLACAKCNTAIHSDCAEESGKCTTFACGSDNFRPYSTNEGLEKIVYIDENTPNVSVKKETRVTIRYQDISELVEQYHDSKSLASVAYTMSYNSSRFFTALKNYVMGGVVDELVNYTHLRHRKSNVESILNKSSERTQYSELASVLGKWSSIACGMGAVLGVTYGSMDALVTLSTGAIFSFVIAASNKPRMEEHVDRTTRQITDYIRKERNIRN